MWEGEIITCVDHTAVESERHTDSHTFFYNAVVSLNFTILFYDTNLSNCLLKHDCKNHDRLLQKMEIPLY